MKQPLRRDNAALWMIALAILVFSAAVFSAKGTTQGVQCQVVMEGIQYEPQPEAAIETQTEAQNQEFAALTASAAIGAVPMPETVLFCYTDANGDTVEVCADTADWTEIDADYLAENAYTLTHGNYYLSESFTTTSTITVGAGTVNLCLNGYAIDANGGGHTVLTVGEGATLSVYDAATGTQTTDDTATDPSTSTGGLITGGYSTGYGAGVYVSANATFYMYGGTIAGNTSANAGGGVYVVNGDFIMYSGSISSNAATGGDGGGVYLNGGTFTMHGGSIAGNIADGRGGGIAVYNDGTLTIESGASIADNAAYNGGGIYNAGTLTLTGGTIAGNTATNNGNGVAVVGAFYLSGAPTVQDVYLYHSYSVATQSSTSYCITLTGAYTGGELPIATAMVPTTQEPFAVVVSGEGDAKYAVSGDDAKGFLYTGTVGELVFLGDAMQLVLWSYQASDDGTTIYRNSNAADATQMGDGGSVAMVAPTGTALIYTGSGIVPTLTTAD